MTTIYLIRHAEAEGNLYRRAHGWYNSTITDRGYRQIAALTKRFTDTKFDAVYSSDRFRTMITALAIYKTHGLPLRTVRALREIDVDGKPFRGALVEHLRTGVRTCYEVDEQTTYWTLWNRRASALLLSRAADMDHERPQRRRSRGRRVSGH